MVSRAERSVGERPGRARRRVDARDARAVPHLLPGDATPTWWADPSGAGGPSSRPGWSATSDGLVGLGVGTGQQWLDFCVMVGHPEWMEDRKLFANRGHLQPDIAAWMAEHTTAEVLELAAAFRIPHAPIGNGATIPATDHFAARGSIVPNPRDGFDEPDRPYRFDPPLLRAPEPGAALGEHDARREPPAAEPGERATAAATGALPLRGPPRARPHRVLGRPALHPRAGDARRRGPPHRVDRPARRHAPARRPPLLGARLVGAVRASSPGSTPTSRA